MIEIDDKIVSADLLRECFACDIEQCKGICCVEGNAGAPLEADEVEILEREYPNYKPYMTAEGIESVERQGFMVVDEDGDLTTPLVDDAQCAYTYTENGAPARRCGARLGIPVYKALREPIVRRFGEEFYKALEAAEELIKQQ